MSITLGGNICIRNGLELDYCFIEAIKSLLAVCDEVVVCDGESTDGTQELIREWMKSEPKLKLCVYPWPNPKGEIGFWCDWMDYNRRHIKSDYQIELDGDEILSEKSYEYILKFKRDTKPTYQTSLWCHRMNFWRDAQSLIPHGECCGHRVVRVGPQNLFMASDGPDSRGNKLVSLAIESPIELFHYGFLRKHDAFFKKARAIQDYFFGSLDPRLEEVEKKFNVPPEAASELKGILDTATKERQSIIAAESNSKNWMTEIKNVDWINRLIPFTGTHPKLAHQWLLERGYKL